MNFDEYTADDSGEMTDVFNENVHPKITLNNIQNGLNISAFDEDIFEKIKNHNNYNKVFDKLLVFINNDKHKRMEFI